MQDQKEETRKKAGIMDMVWAGLALFILVIGITIFWTTVHKAPQADWRNAYTRLPWEGAGVKISEAESYWKNSAGDERMELRAFCFPLCRIKLEQAEGEGVITAIFYDTTGATVGDRIFLPYKDGKFTLGNSASIQVNGNEVTFRLEDGYKNPDLYKLHQVDEKESLWKIEFDCRPDGKQAERLGILSVIPHDL